jgi:hypothetical protein
MDIMNGCCLLLCWGTSTSTAKGWSHSGSSVFGGGEQAAGDTKQTHKTQVPLRLSPQFRRVQLQNFITQQDHGLCRGSKIDNVRTIPGRSEEKVHPVFPVP